jgi:hypothetical protein
MTAGNFIATTATTPTSTFANTTLYMRSGSPKANYFCTKFDFALQRTKMTKLRAFGDPDLMYSVVFANVLVGVVAVVAMKLPAVIWDGGVYFLSLCVVGCSAFYFGGRLQKQYKTHDMIQNSLEDQDAEVPVYIARRSEKATETSALLNTIITILKPGIIDGVRESLKEPIEVGGGYFLYMNKFKLKEHKIVTQDFRVIQKKYLGPDELLLGGKLFLAGDPEIEFQLKSKNAFKPSVDGDINKLNLSANINCKLDFTTYILTIWFTGNIKPDIDLDIDVSIFPLPVNLITEGIVRGLFGKYTESQPLIIEYLMPKEDPQSALPDGSPEFVENVSEQSLSEQSSTYIPDAGTLCITNIRAKDLKAMDVGGQSDPYLKIYIDGEHSKKHKTKHIPKTLNPKWKEKFNLKVRSTLHTIKFEIMDYDFIGKDDVCGHVIKQIAKFTKVNKEKQSHELYLAPQGSIFFDSEWHSDTIDAEKTEKNLKSRKARARPACLVDGKRS